MFGQTPWAIYLNKQTKKYMILKVHVAICIVYLGWNK